MAGRGVRLIRGTPKAATDGGELDFSVPTGDVLLAIYLRVAVVFSSGAGTPAEHEDGAAAFIRDVSLKPSATSQIHSSTPGPMLQFISEYDQLRPLPVDTLDAVESDDGTYELVLPMYLSGIGTADPMAVGFDPRGMSGELILTVALRAFDDIVGTTTETVTSITITPEYELLEGYIPPMQKNGEPRPFAQRRFTTFTRSPAGAGQLDPITLKRKGVFRRLYLETRDDAPLTGSRSDDILDTISIRRNTNDNLVDTWSFQAAAHLVAARRQLTPKVGQAVIDLDPFSDLSRDALVAAQGAGVESLDLLLDALTSGHIRGTAEYLVGMA